MINKLTDIKGIGEKREQALNSLGIYTPHDLLYYSPMRYMDFTHLSKIAEAKNGDRAAFCVEITGVPRLIRAKGMQIVTCKVQDDTAKAQVAWFNQPYRLGAYREGDVVYLYGRIEITGNTRKFSSPTIYKKNPIIVPVYPLKKGVTQSLLQSAMKELLETDSANIEETLPQDIIKKYSLIPLNEALNSLHFPENTDKIADAKRRLAFEDMLLFSTAMNYMRLRRKKSVGTQFCTAGILDEYKKMLPFDLTDGQMSVIADIEKDMSSSHAMNRLVQGDVGSGKTAVALYAMIVAAKNGMQAVLLAPTEILAQQHYKSLCGITEPDNVCLLTGAMTKKSKELAYKKIADGECLYIVGTHALLQEGVEFNKLGLLICDEQQRFGVEQRTALKKKGFAADVLVMSATPIPRTLALVMYGDVDVSRINGMPKGRQKVRTRIVPPAKRRDMYKYLEQEALQGKQAYVVCPQIENDEGEFTNENVKDVYAELKSVLSVKVGILHGKLKAQEKSAVVEQFRAGDIKILVSTTVIEVGVDVPNAVHMAIENADRFGLSQLHQLRGRIGRGSVAGYCFLVSEKGRECERLEALVKTTDGFAIAERDLELRGPGQFLGYAQHGDSELAALAFSCDMATLLQAKEAADSLAVCETEMTSAIVKRALNQFGISDSDFVS